MSSADGQIIKALRWAEAQTNLGNALTTLGEREGESGTALLEEAVAAFRAALVEYTRARAPLQWAATQNNLGNALTALGERESGLVRLEEAVAAYRAALEEYTQIGAPLERAATQNNLGTALATLGERESGTARLEEAVAAYRAALKEYTQARAPLQWATTQNNLGNVLKALGEREGGTARLEEAVTSYHAALEERTRALVPFQWAQTKNNLGVALATLGEHESGTAPLEEAAASYRAALEEYTQARAPLQWAMTQHNLGMALAKLGERESRTVRLEEAVSAYRAALEEYNKAGAPLQSAITQNNLTKALSELGRREVADHTDPKPGRRRPVEIRLPNTTPSRIRNLADARPSFIPRANDLMGRFLDELGKELKNKPVLPVGDTAVDRLPVIFVIDHSDSTQVSGDIIKINELPKRFAESVGQAASEGWQRIRQHLDFYMVGYSTTAEEILGWTPGSELNAAKIPTLKGSGRAAMGAGLGLASSAMIHRLADYHARTLPCYRGYIFQQFSFWKNVMKAAAGRPERRGF
jgi:tetratricopeptide (TPR) repeat protein